MEKTTGMQPLRFSPLLKQIRWGGRRLGTVLGKSIGAAHDYAESWEICDHGADQSVVTHGPLTSWTLQRVLREHATELMGRHAQFTQFPLLIKLLDAQDRLSVQVHPNDEQARAHDALENGKTEAWVIIAAEPGSRIFAGLKPDVDCESLTRALQAGTVEDCLHQIEVAPGDCVFIPAGTVHAIGEGVLLAEVQQSSDLTFRLHDWNRMGTDGKPRTLHIDESLACINFAQGPIERAVPVPVAGASHDVVELVRCPYFVIRRHTTAAPFRVDSDNRAHIFVSLKGEIDCVSGDTRERLALGESLLIPAAACATQIVPRGEVTLLETFLP